MLKSTSATLALQQINNRPTRIALFCHNRKAPCVGRTENEQRFSRKIAIGKLKGSKPLEFNRSGRHTEPRTNGGAA
jgi:hypothetical protein